MIDQMQQVRQFRFAAIAGFIAAHGRDDIGGTRGDVFLHARVRIELELLRQITDAQRAPQRDFARIRHIRAGEDFEQRGFPTAIAADHADFLP